MTYEDFKHTWTGRAADFDGWYGAQCVDLFNFYNRDVVGAGPLFTPDTGGAADLWNDFSGPGNTAYTKIANTPAGVPQPGDVMIWAANSPVTGAAGHVGLFDSGDVNGFYSFDQNYPTGSLPHLQHHDYRGVLGWLHPKQNNQGVTTMNKNQATELALYARLAAGATVEQANAASDYDVAHILADPGYAGALCKQIYDGNEVYRYKAANYDKLDQDAKTALKAANDALSTRDSLIADLKQQVLAAGQAPASDAQAVQTVVAKANPLVSFLAQVWAALTKKG